MLDRNTKILLYLAHSEEIAAGGILMTESKAGRIVLLIFMVAVLAYTVWNYTQGTTSILMLGLTVFIGATTGVRIVQSLIDDFRQS